MADLDDTTTMVISQSQDMGVGFEVEVTAETRVSDLSEMKMEMQVAETKEEICIQEAEKSSTTDENEAAAQTSTSKDETMEEEPRVEEEPTTSKENEETRKRSVAKEVEPVLQRMPSDEKSCGSEVIRINKDQFRIGRKADNDEVILSVLISRNHCIIHREQDTGNWLVTNLSSTDTLLNEKRLEKNETVRMKDGDILQLSLSDSFRYKFSLVDKELEPATKCPRLEANISSEMGDVFDRQKTFVEWQKNERRDIENQLAEKQQEQEQLKEELDKLLEDQKFTKTANEELNNQIVELRKKIEIGNTVELELQQKYGELLEKLEGERLKFEEMLAEEKRKFQDALKESKQEKEQLKVTYAEQIEEIKEQVTKKQEEEWQRKIDGLLQEEKSVQSKLQSEKELLEQKLKEIQEDMRKKDEAAKMQEQLQQRLQQMQQQRQQQIMNQQIKLQPLPQPHQIVLQQRQPQVLLPNQQQRVIVVEVKRDNKTIQKTLPVMETIDLTKAPDSPGTSSKSGQAKEVMSKVSNIMDEQLTCSICSELFIRAMTLNCMHTFCKHCIDCWIKRKRECPNCRATITHMTRSLVVDNFIEKMLESLTPEQMQKRKQLVQERQRLTNVPVPVPHHVHRRANGRRR